MPDQSMTSAMAMIPPGVDPTQYYQSMRQQMLAQLLSQSAVTPPEVQNYGQMRSRLSPLSPLKNIAAALMARKAMDQSMGTQAQMYGNALSAFGGGQQPQQPPTGGGDPNASVGAPTGQSAAPPSAGSAPPMVQPGGHMAGGPLPASAVAPGGGGAPASTNLNPLGLPPQLAFQMWARDPAKYGELIAGTPEWRNVMMASNGNVPLARQMLMAKLVKEGVIESRQGGMIMIPDPNNPGSYRQIRNPNLPQGVEPQYGPGGEITGAGLIPGVAGAEQTLSQAGATGKEMGSVHTFERGSGREVPQFGLTGIAGAPTAPGAAPPDAAPGMPGAAGAPSVPNYFGGSGGAASAPGAQPTSDWWPNMPRIHEDMSIGGPSTVQQELNQLRGKTAGDHITKYGLESDTADQKLEYSAELLRNLPNAFTGPQASGTAHFWNVLNQVPGVKSLIPPGATQDAAGTQIVVKNLVNQAIQGARAIYGPRMAQSEVMLQKNEASPSVTMGLQAIYALQRQEDAKSAYFIQRKNDFDRFLSSGGDPLRFEGSYQRQFPLTTFARQYAERNAAVYQPPKEVAPPNMVADVIAHPERRADFSARYGYLPPDLRQ